MSDARRPVEVLLSSPAADAALVDFVRDRDYSCPICGYNLRALQVPRCPECGEKLTLHVGALEPKLALWMAMLVPLLLTSGLAIFFGILLIRFGLPNNVLFEVSANLISVPLSIAGLLTRRRFQRLSKRAQWQMAVASLLLMAALFICTVKSVR